MTLPADVVTSADDVIAVLPKAFQTDTHPILDGLAETLDAMLEEHQEKSDSVVLQHDILNAIEQWESGLCDDRSCPRAPSESDASLRARALAWPDQTTPTSIIALCNQYTAPLTDGKTQYIESIVDCWFVGNGATGGGGLSFVGDGAQNFQPQYTDRLYEEQAADNDGAYRPQAEPGGALVGDGLGHMFMLRLPGVQSGQEGAYQVIVNAVQRIKGQGMRFAAVVDGKL